MGGFVESVLGPVIAYDADRGTALVDTLAALFRHGSTLAVSSVLGEWTEFTFELARP